MSLGQHCFWGKPLSKHFLTRIQLISMHVSTLDFQSVLDFFYHETNMSAMYIIYVYIYIYKDCFWSFTVRYLNYGHKTSNRHCTFQIGHSLAHHGPGEADQAIFLDEVVCDGNEKSLLDCNSNTWGTHNCNHQEDASVSCFNVTGELNSQALLTVLQSFDSFSESQTSVNSVLWECPSIHQGCI